MGAKSYTVCEANKPSLINLLEENRSHINEALQLLGDKNEETISNLEFKTYSFSGRGLENYEFCILTMDVLFKYFVNRKSVHRNIASKIGIYTGYDSFIKNIEMIEKHSIYKELEPLLGISHTNTPKKYLNSHGILFNNDIENFCNGNALIKGIKFCAFNINMLIAYSKYICCLENGLSNYNADDMTIRLQSDAKFEGDDLVIDCIPIIMYDAPSSDDPEDKILFLSYEKYSLNKNYDKFITMALNFGTLYGVNDTHSKAFVDLISQDMKNFNIRFKNKQVDNEDLKLRVVR